MQSLWAADGGATTQIISLQPEYGLAARVRAKPASEPAAVCSFFNLAVILCSPLAGGILTRKYRKGKKLPDGVRAQLNSDSASVATW